MSTAFTQIITSPAGISAVPPLILRLRSFSERVEELFAEIENAPFLSQEEKEAILQAREAMQRSDEQGLALAICQIEKAIKARGELVELSLNRWRKSFIALLEEKLPKEADSKQYLTAFKGKLKAFSHLNRKLTSREDAWNQRTLQLREQAGVLSAEIQASANEAKQEADDLKKERFSEVEELSRRVNALLSRQLEEANEVESLARDLEEIGEEGETLHQSRISLLHRAEEILKSVK